MTNHWIVVWVWVVGLGGSLLGCAPPVSPGSGATEICTLTNMGLDCKVPPDPPDGMLPVEQVPARTLTTQAMATGASWMGATMSGNTPVLLVLLSGVGISKFTFTNGMATKVGAYLTQEKPQFAALAELDSTVGLDLATVYTDKIGYAKIDTLGPKHDGSKDFKVTVRNFFAGFYGNNFIMSINSTGAVNEIPNGLNIYIASRENVVFDTFSVTNHRRCSISASQIKPDTDILTVFHNVDGTSLPDAVLVYTAMNDTKKLVRTKEGARDPVDAGDVKAQVTGMDILAAGMAGDFVVTKDFTNNELVFYPVKKTDSSLGAPMSLPIKLPASALGSIVALSFGDFIPKSNHAEAIALLKHEKNIYAALLVFTLSPTPTMTPYLIRGEDKKPLSIPTNNNDPVLVQPIDLNNDQKDDLILLDQQSGTIATLSAFGNPVQ